MSPGRNAKQRPTRKNNMPATIKGIEAIKVKDLMEMLSQFNPDDRITFMVDMDDFEKIEAAVESIIPHSSQINLVKL